MGSAPHVSDELLARWTKPAFGNEEAKAVATEKAIRDAVNGHPLLRQLDVRVFAKGSYKNNTNVRRDSDVDIAVEYRSLIQVEYPTGVTDETTGLAPYEGVFHDGGGKHAFKAAVGDALRQAFGTSAVDGSGNKVFTVHESTRSLAADVVPCTRYRYYFPNGSFREGIELILDRPDGLRHSNYPEQHYVNGVEKNRATAKRFKSVTRILKNVENTLVEANEMPQLPSYLIECLAFNVRDAVYLANDPWRDIVTAACALIWAYCRDPEPTAEADRWVEVNDTKFLFHKDQTWTREDAERFAVLAFGLVAD